MIQPDALIKMYSYNYNWLMAHVAEISHTASLKAPPYAGNSLNWLLGHIVSSRTRVLLNLEQEQVWTDMARSRYQHGSDRIDQDGPGVLDFSEIRDVFALTQTRVVEGLMDIGYEILCQPSGYKDNTLADSLAYFHFHETFHIGEVSAVLQALGEEPAWIY